MPVNRVQVFAPGRVNLMGDHTDTNGGLALPCAIQLGVTLHVARALGKSRIVSETQGVAAFDAREPDRLSGWGKYAAGVASALGTRGHQVSNIEGALRSTLPSGAGLSSSAAICVAFTMAWNELDDLYLSPRAIAEVAQSAERDFVGVPCGLLDQLACVFGRKGHAVHIDFRTQSTRTCPLPASMALVVAHTGKHRNLADGDFYAQRVRECAEASAGMGVSTLSEATWEQVSALSGTSFRRARHVYTENLRVSQVAEALEAGDHELLRTAVRASNLSLEEDFEVSGSELQAMIEACESTPGCIGARQTGAGIAGACIAFVEAAAVQDFIREAGSKYRSAGLGEPEFVAVEASNGARVLGLD